MSKQKLAQPRYMVSIDDDPKRAGALLFTFVPKGLVAGEPTREVRDRSPHQACER